MLFLPLQAYFLYFPIDLIYSPEEKWYYCFLRQYTDQNK